MGVCTALESLGSFPDAACKMIRATLPSSLGTLQADRHRYEQSTVEAVAKELDKIEAEFRTKIEEETAVINNMEQEEKLQKESITELETVLGTKQATVQKKKLELCEEATAFQNAKRVVKGAEEKQENQEEELKKIESKKVDLEEIVQGKFQSLKEGSIEQPQATKLASDLVTHVQKLIDLNETLATTIPSALCKEPTSRGPFDTIAIQHMQEDMEKSLMEWNARIRDAEKVKAEHVAEVCTALEAFKTAQERQCTTADSFTAARKDMEETQQLLAAAKKKLKGMPPATEG